MCRVKDSGHMTKTPNYFSFFSVLLDSHVNNRCPWATCSYFDLKHSVGTH